MAPPKAILFVASLWRAIEPWIHPPDRIESARIGRIGVINDTVFERKCAHTWPLANIGRGVSSRHSCESNNTLRFFRVPYFLMREVVFGAAVALLFFGQSHGEIEIEIATE